MSGWPTDAPRGVYPLPLTLDGIDAAWVTAALRTRAPDVTVRGVEIADLDRGTCTKARLHLDLDPAARHAGIPETLFLKGGFEPHSQEKWRMHLSEVRGYNDVLPALGLNSPVCYFAAFDEDNHQAIILMEDLARRDVAFCHPLQPQGYDAVARRLSALAAFHAQTWGSAELGPGGRWHGYTDVVAFCGPFFRAFFAPPWWQRFTGAPRAAAGSVRFSRQDWIDRALDAMARLAATVPHCMIHGDTHLGNLYVDPDGTPGFFDALPKRSPAMNEVSYHIVGALDPVDRRAWDASLVRHYLGELARHGVAPPVFDEAMRQFAAFLALGYLVFLFNDSAFQSEAINTAYTARFSSAMIDHDTTGVLAALA